MTPENSCAEVAQKSKGRGSFRERQLHFISALPSSTQSSPESTPGQGLIGHLLCRDLRKRPASGGRGTARSLAPPGAAGAASSGTLETSASARVRLKAVRCADKTHAQFLAMLPGRAGRATLTRNTQSALPVTDRSRRTLSPTVSRYLSVHPGGGNSRRQTRCGSSVVRTGPSARGRAYHAASNADGHEESAPTEAEVKRARYHQRLRSNQITRRFDRIWQPK